MYILDLIKEIKEIKMLNLTALSKQTAAQQRQATCAGYWLENNIVGFSTSNIKHDPMNAPRKASFYKESRN